MEQKISKNSLQEALSGQVPLTRFAPSPTGYLHFGHVLNAIYVWGIARGLGGQVLLRMEDHDRNRFRPEYEAAILDDLDQLGLVADLGGRKSLESRRSDHRQSSCYHHYNRARKHLLDMSLLYACSCSRKMLAERVQGAPGEELPYDTYCRERRLPRSGKYHLRCRLPDRETPFYDHRLGEQVQHPSHQCGDLVIHDNKGNWSYQFAVVVDDLRQGVNLVIRGMDILSSTGRQILLAKLLGKPLKVQYVHHPLLAGADGVKLSKAHFDRDIHGMLSEGVSPGEILGEAAWLGGLISEKRSVDLDELPDLVLKD